MLFQGYSPFKALKSCVARKVFSSPRGAGYLDRVAVRVPEGSASVLDKIFEKGAVGKELPRTFASILKGVQIYDLRSDHMMQANLIEFLKLD